MAWILAKAEELTAEAVVLEVAVDNLIAQRFYEKFAFTQAGIIPGYYNGLIDAFRLERVLPRADLTG